MTKIDLFEERRLVTASSFAKQARVGRTYVYRLMEEDKVDWCEIDGIKFVILTEKSLLYTPSKGGENGSN